MSDYPWYDSNWLTAYTRTKEFLREHHPHLLSEFIAELEVFKTRYDFEATKLDTPILDEKMIFQARQVIRDINKNKLKNYEFIRMGRQLMGNHPYFSELQEQFCSLVSGIAGEEVEPKYNFLSLYNNLGVCEPHMDSPTAKWTLDVCIDQSDPWPIHFSQVKPWPKKGQYSGDDWQQQVKNDPDNHFTSHTLYPGEGLVFSGSSQWHYRDRINSNKKENYCHLIFFHYVPKGTEKFLSAQNWGNYFNIPELSRNTITPDT